MKLKKVDGSPERRVVTAMVVSKEVLSAVSARWEGEMFASPWANTVGQWCVDHFARYGKAPGKDVTVLFEAWAEDQRDAGTVEAVERLLSSLSGEYKRLAKETPAAVMIDMAADVFNKHALSKTKDRLEAYLEQGDIKKAQEAFDKHKRVEMGASQWVDPLRDKAAIQKAFEDKKAPLVRYPGDLGRFFDDAFENDSFVAFQAPEKRGKSAWLLDLAWTAMRQSRRVALFETGDLSQSQVIRRLMARACKRPLKAAENLKIPTKLVRGEVKGMVEVEHVLKQYPKAMGWGEAWEAAEKTIRRLKSNDSLLRLSVHSNTSISIKGIRAQVDAWHNEGWTADLVIIDYADILAPVLGISDTRDEINMTWKLMKQMSQDYHNCVVTATQADADSYTAITQTRSNFTNDKRKLGHVTSMFAINQTPTEKEQGLFRLNCLARREGDYAEGRCCWTAGNLAVSSPAIRSLF